MFEFIKRPFNCWYVFGIRKKFNPPLRRWDAFIGYLYLVFKGGWHPRPVKRLKLLLYWWRAFTFEFHDTGGGRWYIILRLGVFGLNIYWDYPWWYAKDYDTKKKLHRIYRR